MEHPPDPGKLLYDLQAVPVGLPVVDDHRQVQLQRHLELTAEHHLLEFLRRVLRPVVVQADLPDGHHLFMSAQVPDGVEVLVRAAGAVLRVEPRGGEQPGAALRQGQGGAGALHVHPGDHHSPHPGIGQGVQQRLPVPVKGVVVVVGMGVKQLHGRHLFGRISILRTIITRAAEKKRARIGKSIPARKTKRTSLRMSFQPDMISRSC